MKEEEQMEEQPLAEKPVAEEEIVTKSEEPAELDGWNPVTGLGKQVKNKEITSIDTILDSGQRILETEIVDALLPDLEHDLLLIGQSKGKFGGGQRRIFKQTQKKTKEGNKPRFTTMAIVGNKNGIIGLGMGKSKETVPAREKAIRNAKLHLIKIRRGNGSWEDSSKDHNTIPFKVTGKCGSCQMTLIPAPKGTGLIVEKECAKILEMAGIRDVWSKTLGHTKTKMNLIKACFEALKQTSAMKIQHKHIEDLSIVEGGNVPESFVEELQNV